MSPTKIEMRPYQAEAIAAVRAAAGAGNRRVIVNQPTGTGKTFTGLTMCLSAVRKGNRALWLAHRDELISQPYQAARMLGFAESEIGIVKAESDQCDRPLVIGCTPTLWRENRRNTLFAAGKPFGLVIADEVHHFASASNRALLDALPGNPFVVGLTATIERADRADLKSVFPGDIVYQLPLATAIRDGWLVPFTPLPIDVPGLDLSGVGTNSDGDDYNQDELAEAFEAGLESLNDATARAWSDHCRDRTTVVFCVFVRQALAARDTLRAAGAKAEMVCGETPDDERKAILAALANKDIDVVTNCMVLCLDAETEVLTDEGWITKDAMTYNHNVANWDDGRIFFDKPKFIVRRDRLPGERMVILETERRSIRVTEDHRLLYRTKRDGRFLIKHAGDLVGCAAQLPINGTADAVQIAMPSPSNTSLVSHRRRMISSAYHLRKNNGFGLKESYAEAERRASVRDALTYTKPQDLTLDECELIGFWLGDGSRCKLQSGGVEYTLCQTSVYPKICARIDSLLESSGLDSIKRKKKPGKAGKNDYYVWSIPRGTGFGPQHRRGLFRLEPYLDKNGTCLFFGLNDRQFSALMRGLWMADGSHNDLTTPPPCIQVYGVSHDLFSYLQAVAVCRGYRCSIRAERHPRKVHYKPLLTLSLSHRASHAMTKYTLQFEQGWKAEQVWCVTSTTGNIVTRRRGTVTVMGNTEGWDCPRADALVMARATQSKALYCLDEKTEILTRDGFRGPNQINIGEMVASVDPNSHMISWVPVTGKVDRPMRSDERMFGIKSPSLDIRVTDQHRMLWRGKKAHLPWRISTAVEFASYNDERKILAGGEEPAPGIPLSDHEIRFVAWFMTDGTMNKITNAITITQAQHQPYHAEIEECLRGCGFKFGRYVPARQTSQFKRASPIVHYTISRGRPRGRDKHLTGWGRLAQWLDKDFSRLLDSMDRRQFEVFLDVVNKANGSKQKKEYISHGKAWTQRTLSVCTGNLKFANALQSLAVRRGWRCSLRVFQPPPPSKKLLAILHLRPGIIKSIGGREQIDRACFSEVHAQSGERVWCIENPVGTIITRRNGKVAVLGQCQMLGRGLRPFTDKRTGAVKADCLVIDLVGNTGAHTPYQAAKLLEDMQPRRSESSGCACACEPCADARECERCNCPDCKCPGCGCRSAGRAIRALVAKKTWVHWTPVGSAIAASGPDRLLVVAYPCPDGSGWRVDLWRDRDREPLVDIASPEEMAFGVADDAARRLEAKALMKQTATWRASAASAKMIAALGKWGIAVPDPTTLTAGRASDMMTAAVTRARMRSIGMGAVTIDHAPKSLA